MNQTIGTEPEWFVPYCGMNYQQCSREGAGLIAEASETGAWHEILDRLMFLRGQMRADGSEGIREMKTRLTVEYT